MSERSRMGRAGSNHARMGTAYHEAGHAVVAVRLGLPLKGVTIEPGENYWGAALYGKPPEYANPDSESYSDYRARQYTEHSIIRAFAGQAAKAKWAGRNPNRWESESDVHGAIDSASRHTASNQEIEAWCKYLYVRTKNILDVPAVWAAVEALAGALMRKGTIKGPEARAIIRQALAGQPKGGK